MTTGLLVTAIGRQKLLAFAQGGPAITITHIAVGDANGVPYAPAEGQTALVNERYRMAVSSLGMTNEPAVNIEAIFPADTPDGQNRPSHGFHVHELGVFDNAGALIAVARMGGGFKPAPLVNGQVSARVLIAKLYAANSDSFVAVLDVATWTHIGRMHGLYFLAHAGVMNAPPVSPALGVFHIVGTAPTGAWAGQAGKIAQWTGVMWVFKQAPVALLTVDQSISDNTNPAKWMRRNQAGTAWEQAIASTANIGPTRLATLSEAKDATRSDVALTPAGLAEANASKTLTANQNANQTIATGSFNTLIWHAVSGTSEYVSMNTSTGVATFSRGGTYLIECAVPFTAPSGITSGQLAWEFRKTLAGGGSFSKRPFDSAVTNLFGTSAMAAMPFAPNDQVETQLFVAGGATTHNPSSVRNYLNITRIGD